MRNLRRIRLGVLFTALALLLATGTALAQDVTKVAGGMETHKVILDNAEVRVLDVHLPPGQQVAMHSHPANFVYYVTDAKVKVTSPDGKTAQREFKAGQAVWGEAVTHAVENVGTSEIHLVQTELKQAPAKK